MRYFSFPIAIAAVIDLGGTFACEHYKENDPLVWSTLPGWLQLWWWVLLLLPCVAMLLLDLAVYKVRFSLSHAVFFVSVLFNVTYRAADFSRELEAQLTSTNLVSEVRYRPLARPLSRPASTRTRPRRRRGEARQSTAPSPPPSPGRLHASSPHSVFLPPPVPSLPIPQARVSLFVFVVHMLVFTLIHQLAKLTLVVIATNNTFSQFLFPFQFFDCVFIYTFFSLRTFTEDVGGTWLASIALLQINLVLRSSGTYMAFGLLVLRKLKRCLGHQSAPIADDPLLKLQV